MKTNRRLARGRNGRFAAAAVVLFVGLACNLLQPSASPTTPPPSATIAPLLTVTQPPPPTGFPPTATASVTPPRIIEVTDTAAPPTEIPPPTEVAVVAVPSQVRRLSASVFSGAANPLAELTSNDQIDLAAGGLIATDALGEAEVVIQGCLKLFIFQDSSLQRSTCRQADTQSGLAVCSTGGLTGVLNNCASQVDIQTPSAHVQTDGTWFTVLYLPADQLSIVQVYEGTVGVQALANSNGGTVGREQSLPADNLWFSAPGRNAPNLNGIDGRAAQPMDVWQAIRPTLLDQYPDLDKWYTAAKQVAGQEQLAFPDYLAPPLGKVTIHVAGTSWHDRAAQRAFLQAVAWNYLLKRAYPDFEITPEVEFSVAQRLIPDARKFRFDAKAARPSLEAVSGLNTPSPREIRIGVALSQDGIDLFALAADLQDRLLAAGLNVANVYSDELEQLRQTASEADSGAGFDLIWLEASGGPAFNY